MFKRMTSTGDGERLEIQR